MQLRDLIQQTLQWIESELKKDENSHALQKEVVEPIIQHVLEKL